MNKEELIKISRENLRNSKQSSLCECYDEAFIKGYELSVKRIAELEKENAELKEQCSILADSNVCSSTCSETKKQLTKAKKIIRNCLNLRNSIMTEETEIALIKEAERFLKE